MTRLVVAGATGKMGGAIIRESLNATADIEIVGALASRGGRSEGKDAGQKAGIKALGIPVSSDVSGTMFDVMVDFSRPEALEKNLAVCVQQGSAILIGTTGLSAAQNRLISEAAESIPILFAANTSVGVNLCAALVEMAARVLGQITDIEIVEAHHRHKVDAPSGTALLLVKPPQLEWRWIFPRVILVKECRGQSGFLRFGAGILPVNIRLCLSVKMSA